MTRDELVQEFRTLAFDWVDPYLISSHVWDTEWVIRWLEEAQVEACIRGRLLHESASQEVCQIAVTAGDAVYPLHPVLYELDHIGFRPVGATARTKLRLTSTEDLDSVLPDWRDLTGEPKYAIQGDSSLRLAPTPAAAGTLLLEGYRLPVTPLAATGSSIPEISGAHHRQLLNWALYRAFSTPNSDMYDMDKALKAERDFTSYFGARPDSDLRRITREDAQHHNKAWV